MALHGGKAAGYTVSLVGDPQIAKGRSRLMTTVPATHIPVTQAPMTPEDIGRLRQAGDPRVSPDGSVIAFTVTDPDVQANRYRRRIWLAPMRPEDDGEPYPFTGEGSEYLPRWSPDGRRIAFVSAGENGQASQICVLPARTGGERVVVCCWHGAVTDLAWSPDGSRLAFAARDEDPEQYGQPGEARKGRDMPPRRVTRLLYRLNGDGWTSDRPSRIFVVAADGSGVPRPVTPGPFDASGLAWSPDGRQIAFASARHETWDLDLAADLWMVSADGDAEPERLTEGGRGYFYPSWSPDGRRLAYYVEPTPLESPCHAQVGVLDISSRQRSELTGSLDRNCAPYGTTRGPRWIGERLLFGIEDAGNVHLYRVPADGTGKPSILVGGDRWVAEWDWAAGTLAFIAATPTSTGELLIRALAPDQEAGHDGTGERALTRLTRPFADSVGLVEPERFVARSADGTEVECWAMPPAGAMPGRRYPTLLNVHGGPFTQYGNKFTDDFQLQASAGFGVLYCNPRGSSGLQRAVGPGDPLARVRARPRLGLGRGRLPGRAGLRRRGLRAVRLDRPRPPRDPGRLLRRLHDVLDDRPHRPVPGRLLRAGLQQPARHGVHRRHRRIPAQLRRGQPPGQPGRLRAPVPRSATPGT
jgi:dipeptidyl aminopeptidase/acylaminoacyl peptidase